MGRIDRPFACRLRTRASAALFLSLAACTPPKTGASIDGATAPSAAEWAMSRGVPGQLAPGVSYQVWKRDAEPVSVAHVIALDLDEADVRFAVTPGDASGGSEYRAQTVRAHLERSGADIAINASYFLPFAGGSPGGDDFFPKSGDRSNASGAVIASGTVVSPAEDDIDIRVTAIVCFAGEDVVILEGQVCPAHARNGVAAGPLLLVDGVVQDFTAFDRRFAMTPAPRTAIGASQDGRRLFVVVADGRQPGYSAGAALPDLAALFETLGARNALNLDGGGSSTLVARLPDGRVRTLNRPIHTGVPGRERPVANHLGIFID